MYQSKHPILLIARGLSVIPLQYPHSMIQLVLNLSVGFKVKGVAALAPVLALALSPVLAPALASALKFASGFSPALAPALSLVPPQSNMVSEGGFDVRCTFRKVC